MKKMMSIGALVLVLSGCGQYVSYGDGGDPEPDAIRETATLGDFPELEEFNHYTFAGLVAGHTSVSDDGQYVYVDYLGWSGDEEARYELERYTSALATVDPSQLSSADERLAYWINAYNASVIRGVLEKFEDDTSFRVIDSPDFFGERAYTLGGVTLSLDQIEQGVIRGDFENDGVKALSAEELARVETWHQEMWPDGEIDARFHAAVNCGALGCPNLLASAPFAYQADELDAQLEQATRAWLASPEKGAGADGVSMLFTWYKDDFVNDEGSVEAFIAKWRDGGTDGVALDKSLDYDWALNTK